MRQKAYSHLLFSNIANWMDESHIFQFLESLQLSHQFNFNTFSAILVIRTDGLVHVFLRTEVPRSLDLHRRSIRSPT